MILTKKQTKELKTLVKKLKDSPYPICPICETPMINVYDNISKKMSKYSWKTTCKHYKGVEFMIG